MMRSNLNRCVVNFCAWKIWCFFHMIFVAVEHAPPEKKTNHLPQFMAIVNGIDAAKRKKKTQQQRQEHRFGLWLLLNLLFISFFFCSIVDMRTCVFVSFRLRHLWTALFSVWKMGKHAIFNAVCSRAHSRTHIRSIHLFSFIYFPSMYRICVDIGWPRMHTMLPFILFRNTFILHGRVSLFVIRNKCIRFPVICGLVTCVLYSSHMCTHPRAKRRRLKSTEGTQKMYTQICTFRFYHDFIA